MPVSVLNLHPHWKFYIFLTRFFCSFQGVGHLNIFSLNFFFRVGIWLLVFEYFVHLIITENFITFRASSLQQAIFKDASVFSFFFVAFLSQEIQEEMKKHGHEPVKFLDVKVLIKHGSFSRYM